MKALVRQFRSRYSPLSQLLIIGFGVRLVSVIFSKGFGWHDDHFLIIEASQSWVDGFDYNYWLPDPADPGRQPHGHSLFYVGLHYYLFSFLQSAGIHDPQAKMYIVRFLHALWSLLIIRYGYLIAARYGGARAGWFSGLFLSLYWFMPFISVRNLAEFVSVPPLLFAAWRTGNKNAVLQDYLLAGLAAGLACSVRFQAVFVVAGFGIGLLLQRKKITEVLAFGFSLLLVIALTQGLVDYIIWKRPFAEFLAYTQYNVDHAGVYGADNWHMYFDLVFGMLIPPLSFVLVAGWIRTWRSMPLLFWGVLLYLAFHTWFPNKQERFIMTVLPLMVIAGTVGAYQLYAQWREKIPVRLVSGLTVFVVVLNLLFLLVLTPSYSKRHRVEAMYYLYKKNDSPSFMVEDSNKKNDFLMPPLFYYGRWFSVKGINGTYTADSARAFYDSHPEVDRPGYVVFWQAERIDERVSEVRKRFPGLRYETTIDPSFIDRVLFWLNPLNDNQTAYIYRLDQ